MSLLHRAVCGASLLAFLASPSVRAEDDPDRTVIVTGQRVADADAIAADRAPGGVDVVAREDFENKLAVSVRDTLAFSPGVYTQPRFGQEVRLSIRGSGISRGFHMRGIMLFQDGVPINLADNNGDFQELDPQLFDRLEVYRGGNALRYGGSTLGGAINAVTPTGRSAPGVQLRIDGGSFDTIRGFAAAGFASARGDARLALSTDRADGDRDHARRDALRFNGNAGIRLSGSVETRFYASVNRIDQELPGSLTAAQALSTPRQSLPNNIAQDQARDIDSIRLQNRTTIDLGGGTLTAGVFLNAKQLYHPIFQVIDQQSTDHGAFARLDLDGAIGGVPVAASIGSTARFGRVVARQYVNLAGQRGALTADARQTARTIDSYAELRATPVGGLSLIAGGIYTNGWRAVDNLLNPARSGTAEFNTFSPRFGVLYAPDPAIQFYANYSRSVELPGFSELNQTPFATGGIVTPGFVRIDPQRAWTLEIGTRGSRGIASWDITFYRATLRGELLQFAQAPDIPAATFNAGRTRHQGIEAGLDLSFTRWSRWRQVYQLNDFRFRGDAQFADNRLPVVPLHQYRGEIRVGDDHLSIAPTIEWTPKGAWADYANTTRVPGYALIGIGARAQVREGVTLFVDARNVTGRKAIGDLSAVVAATPASVIYYPVERRAVYGGVRATL